MATYLTSARAPAMVTVRSLPMASKATWLTISGMTGLTFPGMIDDPAWTGGRVGNWSCSVPPLMSAQADSIASARRAHAELSVGLAGGLLYRGERGDERRVAIRIASMTSAPCGIVPEP